MISENASREQFNYVPRFYELVMEERNPGKILLMTVETICSAMQSSEKRVPRASASLTYHFSHFIPSLPTPFIPLTAIPNSEWA